MITLLSVTVNAQNKFTLDSLIREVQLLRQELHKSDSINKLFLDGMYSNLDGMYNNIDKPRYKMYKTENTYNLLKLDTKTGKVWQVQYGMKSVISMVVELNYWGPALESLSYDGRFELYPTPNMYTFIMIDTGTGDMWQVQWNTDPDYRFVRRIYE